MWEWSAMLTPFPGGENCQVAATGLGGTVALRLLWSAVCGNAALDHFAAGKGPGHGMNWTKSGISAMVGPEKYDMKIGDAEVLI
jgi:hypothetical protein